LRKYSQSPRLDQTQHRLSFAALALVLERGRPMSHRILTTSSKNPLHPGRAIKTARELGYDCEVLDRVRSELGRGRFRERCVDENLQWKLHRTLDLDQNLCSPPRWSTIVLATGDGKPAEFKNSGFPCCVEYALDRSWNVELYGWADGMSRVWERRFGGNPRFSVQLLDGYTDHLLD